MRRWIILLNILAVSQLLSQQLQLVLPDTILQVTDVNRVLPTLQASLEYSASRGRLGIIYYLQAIRRDPSSANLVLHFQADSVQIPPPDTTVVLDETGREQPKLALYLQGMESPPGRYLHSGGIPGWQIMNKTYFRSASGYGTRYDVRDVSHQTVQVLAGYDRREGRKGELVGEVALDLPNFLGTLRYLQIHWRRLSSITQTINLAYTEPHLPILPVGTHLAFRQALRDTLYLERDFKVQLTSLPSQQWNTAIGIGSRILRVTSHGQMQGLLSSRQQKLNLSLQRQTFDRPHNPTHGWMFRLFIEGGSVSGKNIDARAALAQIELRCSGVWTATQITLAQEIQAVGVFAANYTPQISEFGRFGGGTTLRGYKEDQFLSPRGIVSRSELRVPLGATSRWHLFMDNGRVAEAPWLASVGIGFVLQTGRELLQLDLAWNRQDSFRSAKLHLRLVGLLAGE